jgi:hypothetical protein
MPKLQHAANRLQQDSAALARASGAEAKAVEPDISMNVPNKIFLVIDILQN